MKKLLVSLLCVVMMVTFMPSMAFAAGEDNPKASQETVVSITIDGVTKDYTTWKDAFDRAMSGKNITVTLRQDVDFTEAGVYSKNSQTNGVFFDIKTEDANVTLDLNGHNVTNHFKNPNGSFPARGFSLNMKGGGTFCVVNSAANVSKFDVEKLGQVKSKVSSKIIEFAFGENIETNTKDLDLEYVVSKYSDFYIGFNGGFKGLQEDGSYNFYTSASDAIKNSTDNTAILVNDYNGPDSFSASSGTNGMVDLNNKTFTTSSTAFNLLHSDVDLTVKNGTINAYSSTAGADSPNVGFIGDTVQDVKNITLTLEKVIINSNYQRGIDFHGTDTDLHLNLVESELNMENENSYGIYMPAKDSTVKVEKSTVKAGTGIAVKGGSLEVIDSKIRSVGAESVPDVGTSSGFEETGDAIYVDGFYKFPISVNIKNSEVISENARAVRDLFVDESQKNTDVVAESGVFSSDVLKYVSTEKASAKVDSKYYIGDSEQVKEVVKNAMESVEVQQGLNNIKVPAGVKVENKTGDTITVNGQLLEKDSIVTTEEPSKISIDGLKDNYTVGDVTEFKVSTKPASYDDSKPVKGYITGLTDEEKGLVKVWYKESRDGKWYELRTDYFGPETGFLFIETASEFKIEFTNKGKLDFGVEIKTIDGVLLASNTKAIEISAKEIGYPDIPPTTPVQKPTIEAEEGATVTLSKDGTTATIVVDKDATLKDVLLNGKSLGAVTEVPNLKTGDKLVVIVETAAEKNARLKAGVENTTIKMYYKKGEIGKGWIKLRFKKSFGYKVDNYEIFRSAKKKTNFGDEAWFVTKTNKTKGFYKNGKSVKKGTRYYYKMRGVREIAGETVYTQWSNIVMRTGR